MRFFDMQQAAAAGVLREIGSRIDAGIRCPARVELKRDAGGIGVLQQQIEHVLILHLVKFGVMVVIPKGEPLFFG